MEHSNRAPRQVRQPCKALQGWLAFAQKFRAEDCQLLQLDQFVGNKVQRLVAEGIPPRRHVQHLQPWAGCGGQRSQAARSDEGAVGAGQGMK